MNASQANGTGRLQGRVAIVTGASQGIGAAVVTRFAREGAHVVGIARNEENLCKVAAETPGIVPFRADVQDHAALERCVQETVDRWGKVDILVNNAAISYYKLLLDSTLEEWRETFRVNLESHYVLAKLVAPHMMKQNYGRLVSVSSTQSIATETTVGAYTATKGGINAFIRQTAVELAPYNILCNVVAPGFVHTPMSFVNGVDETKTEYFQTWYAGKRKIPLARPGEPEEIAAAVLFFASEECSYITGATLVVDGGLTITF